MTDSNAHRPARLFFIHTIAWIIMALSASAQQPLVDQAKAQLRARDYRAAAITLAGLPDDQVKDASEILYLRALALFYAKDYPVAVQIADELITEFPGSDWYYKALFLKAQALVEQKQFKDAEQIYESQAFRLLSEERKHEIAGVIVEFADKLTVKPGPDELDATPPDYGKAHKLYGRALDMQIGRSMRDDVLFKRARAIQDAANPHQAVNELTAYLREFDPNWTGPAGAGGRAGHEPPENPLPAGRHITEARYRLAEAYLAANNHLQARWEAEDLVKMLSRQPQEHAGLLRDIRWLLVNSYRMPRPSADELEKAVQAARHFLTHHRDAENAVQAAYWIPLAYENHARADQAIAAFRAFVATDNYALPPGDAATAKNPTLGKSPAELQDEWEKEAIFRIGNLFFAQQKYTSAIETWQEYARRFPNGPHWAASQNAIVNAKFQMGVDALASKNYDTARAHFNDFLTQHPLDQRARQILFAFGQIHFAQASEMEEKDGTVDTVRDSYQNAIDEWTKLVSKYPGTEESSLALYRIGVIHEEKLGNLDKALESYRKLTWGSYANQAQQRIAVMTNKHLALKTERIYRTNEPARIRLTTRNIEKVTLQVYRLDMEAYYRKIHGIGGVERLDIALIEPEESREIVIENYAKYKLFENEIEIPFDADAPGACVVNVSENDWESTTLVLRSDLDIIFKASRRQVLVFVQNMRTGQPAPGVELLLSDGTALFATGKTGDDGVYQATHDQLKNLNNIRVLANGHGHIAAYNLDVTGLGLSTGLSPKGYVYTDRPTYRPGETVALRAIVRDVRDGAYAVPEAGPFKVVVRDSQARLLHEIEMELNRFGTLTAHVPIPEASPLGEYQISVTRERKNQPPLQFAGTFQVQQFKLEKIAMQMEFQRQVYFRGETVETTVKTAYYWGEPLVNRTIRYTLPDGRTFTGQTDGDGQLRITFDTQGMRPGSALRFQATLDGENVNTEATVFLAALGYTVQVKTSQELALAGAPFNVTVTTTAPDGRPVGRDLTLYVLRRQQPESDQVLDMIPWLGRTSQPVVELTVEEHKLTTAEETGTASLTLNLEKGGTYVLRAAGQDRFDQTVTGTNTVTVSDDKDATRLRVFAESATLKVGDQIQVRLHSRLNPTMALITHEGEEIIRYQTVKLENGFNPLQLEVRHELFPNFRIAVAAIHDRKLHTASKEFEVERELKVTVNPLQKTSAPGAKAQVELHVTDQLGNPVEAELSLALVNEALFAVYPDTTPPILKFFQQDARRHAEFRTGSNTGFEYDGVTRAVVKEVLEEKERLIRRQEEAKRLVGAAQSTADLFAFDNAPSAAPAPSRPGSGARRELSMLEEAPPLELQGMDGRVRRNGGRMEALQKPAEQAAATPRREVRGEGRWIPSIITDAHGRALVEIDMPESTTKWRLTTRGCTGETLVGQATAEMVTRKDFFVDIKLPDKVREGDRVRVLARLHNLTDYEGDVQLRLRLTGQADDETITIAELEQTVAVGGHGSAETVFNEVEIPAVVNVEARLDAIAAAHRDSLAVTLPVEPWGLEYAAHGGGTANADAAVMLKLPDNAYEHYWMTVTLGGSVKSAVIEMALQEGLFPRPLQLAEKSFVMPPPPPVWGGALGSDLLATVSGLAYARENNAPTDDIRRLADKARALVSAAVVSQQADGGWAWHAGGDNSDWAVAARTYWALINARNAGIAVNNDTIERAGKFLQNQFQRFAANDNDAKALVLHALSTNNLADFANGNRLYRERNGLGAAALAYLALAFVNLERAEIAAELAAILETKAQIQNAGDVKHAAWKHDAKHHWMQDDTETTAMVLLALSRALPTSQLAEAAAQYLLASRGCYGFTPAKARGPAVAALAAYFGKAKTADTDARITVLVNGTEIAVIEAQGDMKLHLLTVPTKLIQAGDNRVEFKMTGRGLFAYAATLRGFATEMKDPKSWNYPYIHRRHYYHERLQYKGRPIGARSTSPVQHLENGQRTEVLLDFYNTSFNGYLVVDEPIPAGTTVVTGSLEGNFTHYEITPSHIRFYYRPNYHINDIRYELVGYAPGTFRVLPTVMRDPVQPNRLRVGPVSQITVLAPGENSPDQYTMNKAELYELGRNYFNDNVYDQALEYLAELHRQDHTYNERDLARMLLWIHTTEKYYHAASIVDMFEILRERYPDLEIPFDKILIVGQAYRDIGEFERAWLIYRATITASYISDSNVSALLQDEGRFLASVDYQQQLWREYPDAADVVSSYFALSQALYQNAPNAHAMPEEDGAKPDRIDMLERCVAMLHRFLTLYPADPLADDAAFSLCNAFLDLKNYQTLVRLSRLFVERYPDSNLNSSFQYMAALGLFWQHQFDAALEAARIVAEAESKDKNFAQYIVGQIYHAQSKPGNAIEWYRKVEQIYPDAAQAIEYFEDKRIALDEVNVFRPGEDVQLPFTYRNIKEAAFQIYRVDLMKLYLREKNLSNITKVQLAGIEPELQLTVPLGDGQDYVEKERKIMLKLDKDGAYLVICRGDDLFTSALVLITPLKLEVQEDKVSGRVRVNVLDDDDDAGGGYRAEVHVKAIGSANREFRSGETDLRGIFVADAIRGESTIIARDAEARYAFYRGSQWLGPPKEQQAQPKPSQQAQPQLDYQKNLRMSNEMIQNYNVQQFEQMRRQSQKGVQVKAAF